MYNIYDCEIDNQYLLKDQVIEYIRNAKEAVKTEEATNILERLEAAISLLPGADVAPVVRCKDCEHWGTRKADGYGFCCIWGASVNENAFCSSGVKEDAK